MLAVHSRPNYIAADLRLASDCVRHPGSVDEQLTYSLSSEKPMCMPKKNWLAHSTTVNKVSDHLTQHPAREWM